ncbi:hypothetical protein ACFL17_09135 [Pseudomonadota bacterium]
MATTTKNSHIPGIPQIVRDQNARQLRSDYLASMLKTLGNTFYERLTRPVGEVRTTA